MAELLFEILSEEIPARMQARAAEDLGKLVGEGLAAARLSAGRLSVHVTPRRLALMAEGLPDMQPDLSEERKGPRVGAPEQAVRGFLKANGLASLDQCAQRDTGKGVFYFAVIERPGRPTAAVLPEILAAAAAALPWPKSMRWADRTERWVRPIQGVVALLDGVVLPVALAGIEARAATRGHRFLAPDPIPVRGAADYVLGLEAAKVILDPRERRRVIAATAESLAEAEGLRWRRDAQLLDEVAGLVEWPVVLMGRIDEAFMSVPPEVLVTSMRTHQKYFAVERADGGLAPRFIMVANTEGSDGGRQIIAGNERVLRARLADAKFFWEQDLRQSLEQRVPALGEIIFQAKLGTLADKVSRIQTLAAELAPAIPGADLDQVRSAARLCKADLTSGMVGEFPELQGLMGRYYALQEGEKVAVADAIAEHYSPLGPHDACPRRPVSVAVALADKIDTLVGFFAIGETPTGSKDPFALRRAALGAIRLILENKLRLGLREVFYKAYWSYNESRPDFEKSLPKGHQPKKVVSQLLDFFADRLKVHLREAGVRHDLVSAVFALGDEDDLVRLLARVDALKDFLVTDDGANLLTAYARAANIVRIEEKKDGATHDGPPDRAMLVAPEEKAVAEAMDRVGDLVATALAREDFAGAMGTLAGLRAPVDRFFDKVTVNAPEAALRANRLKLLSRIRATMNGVADFSRIEG